jgi:UPF0755 protein
MIKNDKMRRLIVVSIITIILFVLTSLWWNHNLSPLNTKDQTQKIFVIQEGAGIRQIANNLKSEGIIRDSVAFFLLIKKEKLDNKIQAGVFRLSPSQSAEEIAKSLTVGTPLDIWVTIPEGKRATEIAAILKEKIPTYDNSWEERLIAEEGYLFPDTYLISKDATIDQIITTLRNTFEERYKNVDNTTSLSKEEIVILASMIEREAKHEEDRPLISSVMHNRLKIDMPLQIDATVQYALGYDVGEKSWWKRGLTFDDLKLNSPYNTYTNTGLPPGPISNPGLRVLIAAANPQKSDYLFYIADKSGTNRYARTYEEHNANIKKYGL